MLGRSRLGTSGWWIKDDKLLVVLNSLFDLEPDIWFAARSGLLRDAAVDVFALDHWPELVWNVRVSSTDDAWLCVRYFFDRKFHLVWLSYCKI